MPDTPITVEVVDSKGNVVDRKPLNFYYSEFFHYANNFEVPKPGDYTLRATIGVPTFNRHGERSQPPPLATGAKVTFEDVPLESS